MACTPNLHTSTCFDFKNESPVYNLLLYFVTEYNNLMCDISDLPKWRRYTVLLLVCCCDQPDMTFENSGNIVT